MNFPLPDYIEFKRKTWAEWRAQLKQEALGASMARDIERAAFAKDPMGWALVAHNAANASEPKAHGKTKSARKRRTRQVHVGRVTALGVRRHGRMRLNRQLIADGLYEED